MRILVLPDDFPTLTVKVTAEPSPGYIFFSNFNSFNLTSTNPKYGRYLVIADHRGTPVWFHKTPSPKAYFGVQPNGQISFFSRLDNAYYTMDITTRALLRSYTIGEPYKKTDDHEFLLLADGSYYIATYHDRRMDLSTMGGPADSVVTGFVVRHRSAEDALLFEWKSWDHFKITDSFDDIFSQPLDYAHFNSLDLDLDGGLVVSSRNMGEVTKIDRKTGKIVWRLGGKNNMFVFKDDPLGQFYDQHCARITKAGTLMLYDNGQGHNPDRSRAVEYRLNTTTMTAHHMWSFVNPTTIYTPAQGSVQRLPNGRTFIGWGFLSPVIFSEVTPDGQVVLEASLPQGEVIARAQKVANWTPPAGLFQDT